MKLRAFEMPDGSVRVTSYVPTARRPDESEEEFKRRATPPEILAAAVAHVDVEREELPAAAVHCAECDEEHSCREQWRVKDGRLVRDPDAPNVKGQQQHQRVQDLRLLQDAKAPLEAKLAAYGRIQPRPR